MQMTTDAGPAVAQQRIVWPALGVGIAALALYAATCAPDVLWGDSAALQVRVTSGQLTSPLGLALAHPLYILAARTWSILPFGNAACRVNLFSAICAAATLALVFAFVARLTFRMFGAWVAVIVLGLSHTFWTHAVIAEVYALYALGLATELCLLERYTATGRRAWLMAAFFINGLGVCNHLLAILHVPAYAIFITSRAVRRTLRWQHVLLAGIFWISGASLYIAMIAGEIAVRGDWLAVAKEALTGRPYAEQIGGDAFPFGRQALRTLAAFVWNFPTAAFLAAGLAMAAMRPKGGDTVKRPRMAVASDGNSALARFCVLLLLTNLVFGFLYRVPDQYVFFIPSYVLIAIFVGLGAARAGHTPTWRWMLIALAALPALVYEIVPPILERYDIGLASVRRIPGRREYLHLLRPRKNGDHSARSYGTSALQTAGPGGLILADSTIKPVLIYLRDIEGIGRDVILQAGAETDMKEPTLVTAPEVVRRYADQGRAFICAPEMHLPWLHEQYEFIPAGLIYRLKPRL